MPGARRVASRRARPALWYELFVRPLGEQKAHLAVLAVALFLLALAQSGLLLFLGPFMKALFGLGGMAAELSLGDFLPVEWARRWPGSAQLRLARATLVWAVPAGLLVASLARSLALYLYQWHAAALALYVSKVYRDRLFAGVLGRSYVEISLRSPAEWMSALMNDVLLLQTRFSDILNSFVRDTVVMLAAFLTLSLIHWPTALILLGLAPLIAGGMGRTGKRIAFFAEAFQRELATIADFTLELRKRFAFVRAQRGEERELERFKVVNDAYYGMIRRSLWVRAAFAPLMELLGFATFCGVTLAVGLQKMGDGFAAVNLLVFFGALGLLLRPLRNFGEQLARFQETRGSLAQSLELFGEVNAAGERPEKRGSLRPAPAVTPPEQTAAVEGHSKGLRIDALQTGHRGRAWRLEATGLSFGPGKSVAIIGPSGGGKSTLLKTLAGLIEPLAWAGTCTAASCAKQVAMVSQEPFLFEDSLRANLCYGLPRGQGCDDEVIFAALRRVQMDVEVASLPAQLDFPYRSLARNLSGGQIQRLVIARALLRGKPLLLLDEATAAVDEESERAITLSLTAACQTGEVGLVAVTHRLRWLDAFDEVWFVEDGRVRAQGSHALLIPTQARYREYCGASESDLSSHV